MKNYELTRRALPVVAVLAALSLGAGIVLNVQGREGGTAQTPSADDVVARVNEQTITRNEVAAEIEAVFGARLQSLPAEQAEAMRSELEAQVLESMIVERLLAAAVKERGITVDAQRVQDRVDRLAAGLPEDQTLQDALAAANMTEKDLRERLAFAMATDELLTAQVGKIDAPTDREIQAFYDENASMFRRSETETVPLSEAHARIAEHLSERKKMMAIEAFVETLRQKATVVYAERDAENG
jgi:hypothetical protein